MSLLLRAPHWLFWWAANFKNSTRTNQPPTDTSGKAMVWKFCMQTDQGLLRKNNEDAAWFDEASGMAVLADGMGGYNAGEVASAMAVSTLANGLGKHIQALADSSADMARALCQSVKQTNQLIFEAAHTNPAYRGMGTTLVLGVFRGQQLMLGHIGDSRCYRLRAGALAQITRDHSVLQAKIDAGFITLEQAKQSKEQNLLTRALGVDLATELELNCHDALPGDLYLLCSDGLTDMVSDEDILSTLEHSQTLEKRATGLIQQANQQGGRDNITVLLAHLAADQLEHE
jgi:PPM family protein phosphatase